MLMMGRPLALAVSMFGCLAITTSVVAQTPPEEPEARPDVRRVAPKEIQRLHLDVAKTMELKPGTPLKAYEMGWRESSPEEVTKRILAAAAVMLNREIEEATFTESLRATVSADKAGRWGMFEPAPQLLVKYEPDYDEIRLLNDELDVVRDPGGDIGEDAVREVAEETLKGLIKGGALDELLYKDAVMQLGYRRVGSGTLDGKVAQDRITEYRVTLRPRLDGIELANAGVRMGILATGELVSLRFGGVTPSGNWEQGRFKPGGRGGDREAKVDASSLMSRFYASLPKGAEADVAWSRLMYVMPEGQKTAVVEPMLVVSFTERGLVDGERVSSRRWTLAYSVVDREAAPLDFGRSTTKPEQVEPTRQR